MTAEQAKLIKDFADKTLIDAQDYILAKLLDSNADLIQLQADYRAAMAFWQKIENAIADGKDAMVKLKKMEEYDEQV